MVSHWFAVNSLFSVSAESDEMSDGPSLLTTYQLLHHLRRVCQTKTCRDTVMSNTAQKGESSDEDDSVKEPTGYDWRGMGDARGRAL